MTTQGLYNIIPGNNFQLYEHIFTDVEVIMSEAVCHNWTQPVIFVLKAYDQLKMFASKSDLFLTLTNESKLKVFTFIWNHLTLSRKKGFAMN